MTVMRKTDQLEEVAIAKRANAMDGENTVGGSDYIGASWGRSRSFRFILLLPPSRLHLSSLTHCTADNFAHLLPSFRFPFKVDPDHRTVDRNTYTWLYRNHAQLASRFKALEFRIFYQVSDACRLTADE